MKRRQLLGLSLLAAGVAGLFVAGSAPGGLQKAGKNTSTAEASGGQKPVETDMHEFMENLYKPSYLRLREVMAKRPSRSKWRHVKAESLLLAESANLLLGRVPDENGALWKKLAVENRDSGAKLYAAAKKRDYETAKKHYTAMIKSCNTCHQKFAGGEHQLKP